MRRLLVPLALILLSAAPALAETIEVRMLNRGEAGPMPYEPDYLELKPGDIVRFISVSTGHNAATIDGFIPEGAEAFRGKLNEEIEVTFTTPGFYGIKCTPHYAMGMVMLIQVGEAPADQVTLPENLPPRAKKRFEDIIARATAK
ncbi:pseudoazurin [Rhizobiaceae bacterium BDR2-2]|uniref:Pseudoazurin n=1 Tax=Ectorhizobium quercum TaxID=2965071 RepID=A0AAE3MYQ0_9HYPH|nr:pseudoazurin [Ectorhizobium quercum]MCX8997483.1 pseudoazurin [Ectorhizobium quercum]